jgi:Concanavalin A-like lectin/glucanases superfamily
MRRWWASLAGAAVVAAAARPLRGAGLASASTSVAIWNMDEKAGSTTMVDSSGHHNNGTLHSVKAGVAGHIGTAYQFGGSTVKSYVEVPNSASLNPGSSPITITFWMKTTHVPSSGDYDLVRKGDFPGEEYKVELVKTNQIACTFHGSLHSSNATGGSNIANGKWHQIVCSENSTAITLAIDGRVVKTTKVNVGSISTTTPVEIGAHPGSDYYNGVLDDASIAVG